MTKNLEKIFELSNNTEIFDNLKEFRNDLKEKKSQEYILSVFYIAKTLEDYINTINVDKVLSKFFVIKICIKEDLESNRYYFEIKMDNTMNHSSINEIRELINDIFNDNCNDESIDFFTPPDFKIEIKHIDVLNECIKEKVIQSMLNKNDYINYQKWCLEKTLKNGELKNTNNLLKV